MSHKSLECLYLHGFASGPSSAKARFFRTKLESIGLRVHVPDLNGKSFSELTLSGQLDLIDQLISGVHSDVVMIGSSMGGLLATIAHERYANVRGLVLLAPGFSLNQRWHELLGPEKLNDWRRTGSTPVFHHAFNKELPLDYKFIEDAEQFETSQLNVHVPTLIMHGVNDSVVPPDESRNFAHRNAKLVELHVLDSDHGLVDVLDEMWSLTESFLAEHSLIETVCAEDG